MTDPWRAFCDSLPRDVDFDQIHELRHKHDAGFIDSKEFYDGLEELTGHDQEAIRRELTEEYAKNHLLIDYIRHLKKTYKIGMISNVSDDWIRDNLLTKDEQALFDALVFSYEVGVTKPHERIYQVAIEQLGVEYEECVFVDDIERYTVAAEDLGMRSIIYKDFHQMRQELEEVLPTQGGGGGN